MTFFEGRRPSSTLRGEWFFGEFNEREQAIAELQRLQQLYKDRILTKEEFEEKKKKYLEVIWLLVWKTPPWQNRVGWVYYK